MSIKSSKQIHPKRESISKLIFSNIITTPCEKVLSIILDAKNFIQNNTKGQYALIESLEWAIEVISSRSLYSYEIKEKEKVNKLSQENPEFKELVDFVSEYNDKVIKMDRKFNIILTDKLLQKPSTNLNKKKIKRKTSFNREQTKFLNFSQSEEQDNMFTNNEQHTINIIDDDGEEDQISYTNNTDIISPNNNDNKKIISISSKNSSKINPRIIPNKKNQQKININDKEENKSQAFEILKGYFNPNSLDINQRRKQSHDKNTKNKALFFPPVRKISININKNNKIPNKTNNTKKRINTEESKIKRRFSSFNTFNVLKSNLNSNEKKPRIKTSATDKSIPHISKNHFPFLNIQNKLTQEGYDIAKIINEKNFDIFTLKDIIGYNNVLPFVGRLILENLGLIDEEILSIKKLDPFLIAVNNQYKPEVLYHNCLHGTDVTQSCYIFFTYSNAEKIAQTKVLDLLSIFIAALGHDIAHPGLTNTFHINDSTDIAITYNDISVLENYHASTLFKTIRKSETNIFEKLTPMDYKIIRKRMISEILATDMALHGKVLSLIKSKISFNEDDMTYKLNLLSGDEKTKSDEQQSLLDFMIHLADLAHNTRLFKISVKWVELLSEEFWRQGDLEKEHNLPVSFLCDRDDVNIPQSQKGFISGFILSTYETLGNIFPALKFTYENANNNLEEWKRLLNEGRKKGWTPQKNNNKKHIQSKFKKAETKNYNKHNFKIWKRTIDKNNNINENDDEDINKDDIKEEKALIINSVKNRKNIKLNLVNIIERNNIIKRNLNNNDINKKNNSIRTSSKLKLSINDDFPLMENNSGCSEFKLLNSKKDKNDVKIKIYKYNDKCLTKKNANKKKNCK